MEREPLGFPPSSAPRDYSQRTSGWGQAIEHEPETRFTASAEPPTSRVYLIRATSCRTRGCSSLSRPGQTAQIPQTRQRRRRRGRRLLLRGSSSHGACWKPAPGTPSKQFGRVGGVAALHQHRQSGRRRRDCCSAACSRREPWLAVELTGPVGGARVLHRRGRGAAGAAPVGELFAFQTSTLARPDWTV
jgi:hypothetical protein